MSAQEFLESGLLYYVNSLLLWPLGVALTVPLRSDGSMKYRLGVVTIEPAETIAEGDAEGSTAARDAASRWIARRLAMMPVDERAKALWALRDSDLLGVFLGQDAEK